MTSEEQNKGSAAPPLFGLVLAGGKSTRMGQDKSVLHWHGKEQRYYMSDMLARLCSEVYISCRDGQQGGISQEYRVVVDDYEGAGPLIGILSAFKSNPDVAWLVVACDLPLLNIETLQYLVSNRDPSCIATTFRSPFDGLPEPLITIWEPKGFAVLQAHIAAGFGCPRKALIRNEANIKMLTPQEPNALMNANTPADTQMAMELLNQHAIAKN